MAKNINEIYGINDRRIYYLTRCKESVTMEEQALIADLELNYPDIRTESLAEIGWDLERKGFIEIINLYPDLEMFDEQGDPIKYNFRTKKQLQHRRA